MQKEKLYFEANMIISCIDKELFSLGYFGSLKEKKMERSEYRIELPSKNISVIMLLSREFRLNAQHIKEKAMKRKDIQIRDPFVLPLQDEKRYCLYGTTDTDPWKAPGIGFDTYISENLEEWEGPYPVFRPRLGFWASHNFWAPEVYKYRESYYMFASFKSPEHERATQILRATVPFGPFLVHSNEPVTPSGWECLDGTFWEEEGQPWLVFSREWIEVNDGEIWAAPLSIDLDRLEAEPILLFRGSDASWTKKMKRRDGSGLEDARVTDGPFLYRSKSGTLFMLWSSIGESGYAMGYARSQSGKLIGPWLQESKPLVEGGRGHGMIFCGLDEKTYLAYHFPNETPYERFHYREIELSDSNIVLIGEEL